MKSGIYILLAGILCAEVTNNNLYGQLAKADLLNRNSLIKIEIESSTSAETPSYKLSASRRVNPAAMRNFLQEYKNIDSVRWYQSDKGSAASFIIDEVEIVTCYDKYGNWESRRKYYKENKLPDYIRDMVKHAYPDFAIKGIMEFEYRDKPIYAITLESKTTWVQLKVVNFEIQLVKKFLKRE